MLAGAIATIGNLAAVGPAQSMRPWPDGVDALALAGFAGLAFGLPALGYGLMALDIRAYLRSLRRALTVVTGVVARDTPYWALRRDRPPCLVALDLALPCTEDEVLRAYRERVKSLHPDRGGDLGQFLRLQKHFEQALYLVRNRATRLAFVSASCSESRSL